MIPQAHQRTVREERATTDAGDNLFGAWWEGLDMDIAKAEVRPVSYRTARYIIEDYEWMGCMAACTSHSFGIFFDGACGGVVCFGPEYSENLGVVAREQGRKCADWSKYGYEGKMILLNRGACVHWAHPHAASKLITSAIKMLPPQYKVITATVDDLAGEVGTIYQACNFHYVGSMRDGNSNVSSNKGDRNAWLIDGKLYGSRAMRQKLGGTTKASAMQKRFPGAVKVKQNSKGRYFFFRGSRTERKHLLAAISHLTRPYPKRDNGRVVSE